MEQNIEIGSVVTIKKEAVYGGLTVSRGAWVPPYISGPNRRYTVQEIADNRGSREALLGELLSWIPLSYLTAV